MHLDDHPSGKDAIPATEVATPHAPDRDVFEGRYHERCNVAYQTAWSTLRNVTDAEHVAHDTMSKLWDQGPAMWATRPEGQVRNWLKTTAKNHALDLRGKSARLPSDPLDDSDTGAAGATGDFAQQVVDDADLRERLRDFLLRLPPQQCACFYLRYLVGLEIEEIMSQRHLSRETVLRYSNLAREAYKREFPRPSTRTARVQPEIPTQTQEEQVSTDE